MHPGAQRLTASACFSFVCYPFGDLIHGLDASGYSAFGAKHDVPSSFVDIRFSCASFHVAMSLKDCALFFAVIFRRFVLFVDLRLSGRSDGVGAGDGDGWS